MKTFNFYKSFLIIGILAVLLIAPALAADMTPLTPDDEARIMFVTPDFELLPLSAIPCDQEVEMYDWMFSHLMELIPRPGGYEVTIRHDDGTKETKFFTEFSNGQPFLTPGPGLHYWAYALSDDEVRNAAEIYGQEMSLGEFVEIVAPLEFENMDDATRSMLYSRPMVWPDDDWMDKYLSGEKLWIMEISFSAAQPVYSEGDDKDLLPDLSGVPVGTQVIQGENWEVKIQVWDEPFSSMAALYQARYPDEWAALSPDTKKRLESVPARLGVVYTSRAMNKDQEALVRSIWGSDMTNEEYYILVWPDLWAAIPSWKKESGWADKPYDWDISMDYVDLGRYGGPSETASGKKPKNLYIPDAWLTPDETGKNGGENAPLVSTDPAFHKKMLQTANADRSLVRNLQDSFSDMVNRNLTDFSSNQMKRDLPDFSRNLASNFTSRALAGRNEVRELVIPQVVASPATSTIDPSGSKALINLRKELIPGVGTTTTRESLLKDRSLPTTSGRDAHLENAFTVS
jgi:hypothetical protein